MRSIRLWYCLYLDKRLEDMKILKLKVEKQLADNLKLLSVKEFFEFSYRAGFTERTTSEQVAFSRGECLKEWEKPYTKPRRKRNV